MSFVIEGRTLPSPPHFLCQAFRVVLIALLAASALSGGPSQAATTSTPSCAADPSQVLLSGLAYGPYHVGQSPDTKVYPSTAEIAADMPTLACLTRNIRIYSSLGPAADIVRAAEAYGISVNLGIWLGRDAKANAQEIAAGLRLAARPAVRTLTVGNEVLLRGDLTEKQLRATIQQVRAKVLTLGHPVEVTTADVDGEWLAHPGVARDVDVITVHLYPFWQQVAITRALQTLITSYTRIRHTFPTKQVVIGETGWPSAGPAKGAAVPNPANQARYFREFLAWSGRQTPTVPFFYFDVFDEGWKTNEAGVGTHWGLYGADAVLKPALRSLLPPAAGATLKERANLDVFVGGLASGFGLGIDTSHHDRSWLTVRNGVMRLSYPHSRQWGSLFITAGKAAAAGRRTGIDLRRYNSLLLDLKATTAGQCIRLGIKDNKQPDNGSEMTVRQCPGTVWSAVALPLDAFTGVDRAHLYVVLEIVFQGESARTIEVRNVRLSPRKVAALPVPGPEPMPFTVYTEARSSNNHFIPSGYMGDAKSITMREDSTDHPYSGTTCTAVSYRGSSTWAGVYWQDPANNWGTTKGQTGYDLRNASKISFWVRGTSRGPTITFLVGGITHVNGDSLQPAVKTNVTLTPHWQRVTIDLSKADLSHIIGGFGWTAAGRQGTQFYLDDIVYS